MTRVHASTPIGTRTRSLMSMLVFGTVFATSASGSDAKHQDIVPPASDRASGATGHAPTGLPMNVWAFESLQRRLPTPFTSIETPNFILLTDAGQAVAERHAQWIEQTYVQFHRFARSCGIRPRPLQHKLISVVFEHADDYRAFAQQHDNMHDPLITSYYAPRADRVVLCLNDDSPSRSRRAPDALLASNAGESAAGVLRYEPQDGQTAPESRRGAGEAMPDLLSPEAAVKCVHETIHQLMFQTGIMAPDTQYPLWVCEGLSTAFETTTPEAPFGPDVDSSPRRQSFQRLLEQDELLPLRTLVTLTRLPGGSPRGVRMLYHQSYALVTWMCQHRPAELRTYLELMLDEPAGSPTSKRHLAVFERAFGDVDLLEGAWLTHERQKHLAAGTPSN